MPRPEDDAYDLYQDHSNHAAALTMDKTCSKSGCVTAPNPYLPPEILDSAFRYLDKKKDLKAAALCSHTFHASILPHLYRHIELLSGTKARFSWQPKFEHLRPLTLLLHRQPERARMVRSFTIRGAVVDFDEVKRLQREDDDYSLRDHGDRVHVPTEFSQSMQLWSLTQSDEDRWYSGAGSLACDDALLALMLSKLINLERLDLRIPYTGKSSITGTFLSCAIAPPAVKDVGHFRQLRDVMFDYDSRGRQTSGFALESGILGLPFIRNLFLCSVGRNETRSNVKMYGLDAVATGSSPVKLIEMRNSRITSADITNLLRIPQALQTFIYQYDPFERPDHPPAIFAKALEQQAGSLENLAIDYPSRKNYWGDISRQAVPSLLMLTNLTRLRLPSLLIFPSDSTTFEEDLRHFKGIVPPQLEELWVTDVDTEEVEDSDCRYPSLIAALSRAEICMSKLQRIVLDGRFLDDAGYDDSMAVRESVQRMVLTASEVGIQVAIMDAGHVCEETAYDCYGELDRPWGWNRDLGWAPCRGLSNKEPRYRNVEVDVFQQSDQKRLVVHG